jgi:hypothetical protein
MTDTSIHPTGKKGNNKGHNGPICAPRNPNRKGKLAKASAELDRRRRDVNATHYRAPGSMQG